MDQTHPPRKTAPPKKKTASAKKTGKTPARPKKKTVPRKIAKKVAGGAIRTTTQENKFNQRKTIPDNATLILSDEKYSAAVLDEMKKRFPPEAIVDKYEELLKATYQNKHGDSIMDARTIQAVLKDISYMVVGKPVDKVQTTETTVWSYEEVEKMIEHSPALRNALREMLAPYDDVDRAGKEQ